MWITNIELHGSSRRGLVGCRLGNPITNHHPWSQRFDTHSPSATMKRHTTISRTNIANKLYAMWIYECYVKYSPSVHCPPPTHVKYYINNIRPPLPDALRLFLGAILSNNYVCVPELNNKYTTNSRQNRRIDTRMQNTVSVLVSVGFLFKQHHMFKMLLFAKIVVFRSIMCVRAYEINTVQSSPRAFRGGSFFSSMMWCVVGVWSKLMSCILCRFMRVAFWVAVKFARVVKLIVAYKSNA